ncbi:unnamed protein product, partial [Polarella glacialis]
MAASLLHVYYSFLFIATGGLLFGFIIGINGNVVTEGQMICPKTWVGPVGTMTSFGYGQCYDLGVWAQGFLSSLNLIGAAVSSMVCFRYADLMGRKLEVQVGASLYFLGSCVAALSPMLWGIYLGFFIYGLGIGFAMHAAPIYIAEIAPSDVRGTLVSAKELVIVGGIFLGFAVGAIFSGWAQDGWRFMVVTAAVFAVIMEVGITFIPNSPRWLVLQSVRRGSESGLLAFAENAWVEQARAALLFLRRGSSSEEVEAELRSMTRDAGESNGQQLANCSETFRYPKPLVIGCGLVFLQQVTGQPSVLYFATDIFKDAGFASTAALSSLGVGAVKLLATFFAVWRVDQFGRRTLLLSGIAMMIVALALLGTAFSFRYCSEAGVAIADCQSDSITLPRSWAILTVIALGVYVSGYQIGFGPISWLMISEIFPLGVRGSALSTAALVNFSSNILMTLCQTALMKALTPAGTFFAYLVLAVVSFVFVYYIVPETKGKSLEEIEDEMTGRKVQSLFPDMSELASLARAAEGKLSSATGAPATQHSRWQAAQPEANLPPVFPPTLGGWAENEVHPDEGVQEAESDSDDELPSIKPQVRSFDPVNQRQARAKSGSTRGKDSAKAFKDTPGLKDLLSPFPGLESLVSRPHAKEKGG